jgi:hypothetical protein
MLHRIEALRGCRGCPCCLRPADKGCAVLARRHLSTVEAVARAVELLEGPELAKPLDELHQGMVQRVFQRRGYL